MAKFVEIYNFHGDAISLNLDNVQFFQIRSHTSNSFYIEAVTISGQSINLTEFQNRADAQAYLRRFSSSEPFPLTDR